MRPSVTCAFWITGKVVRAEEKGKARRYRRTWDITKLKEIHRMMMMITTREY